jgi:hypothetical protein
LNSARLFLRLPYRVVVIDDSRELGTWRRLARYREVDLIRNWRRNGINHLVRSLRRGYRHALGRYDFEAILKVDTDALITGSGVDEDILRFVRDHPNAGMIGSRSWRDRTDHVWRKVLEDNQAMWGSYLRLAQAHGYVTGESVLGGAYVLSRACVATLGAKGYLNLQLTGDYLSEDVMFSLLAQAAGFELKEFADRGQPFALAWRGLPMPPNQILAEGKKVVHSLKLDAEDLALRAVFARNRRRVAAAGSSRLPSETLALERHSRRLKIWLKWCPVAVRALRENRPIRARRIFRRCARVLPGLPLVWGGLVASFLPRSVNRSLYALRRAARRIIGSDER